MRAHTIPKVLALRGIIQYLSLNRYKIYFTTVLSKLLITVIRPFLHIRILN